jgi:transposase
MPKAKIDKVKLNQLLTAGKSQREVAQVFGVTEGAVSKAKKELNINVVKNVALENAHKVVDKNLDAVAQLQKINQDANEILDLLMRWNRGDEEALQVLESQVKKVRVRKTEKFVEEFKFKDPRELALRAMGEIRGQLNLQLDIFKTLYDMQAVQEFQREVLEAIGEVEPDVRSKIIERLKERRALRGSISIN